MAFRVFADTNVYLDYLMERGKEWKSAGAMFQLAEKNAIEIYTSSSCLINLIYIMGTFKLSRQQIITTTNTLLSYSKLINPDNTMFQLALSSGFTDLEDAVQYYTALQQKGMDYFITSNIRDYKKSLPQLPVLSPQQFMQQYAKLNQ